MAGEPLRCFFALPLQKAAVDGVQALQRRLAASAGGVHSRLRWLRREQLHLTLKFLGSTAHDSLPTLSQALGAEARRTPPIAARAAALDAFPSPRRAGVLVVRLEDEGAAIARLATALEVAAERVGVAAETRPFDAHITLARARPAADFRALIAAPVFEPLAFAFDEVRLYASLLTRSGSEYSVLAAAPLAG